LQLALDFFFTIVPSTSSAHLIGFQILAGVGTGFGMQNALIAIQVEFRDNPRLLGQASGMASFAQFFGGTVGLGLAEPVFASELSKYLLIFAPEANSTIVRESPVAIYTDLPASQIPGVVVAYTHALRVVFIIGVPAAGLALITAMFIKNLRIVKAAPPAPAGAAKPPAATEAAAVEAQVVKGEKDDKDSEKDERSDAN